MDWFLWNRGSMDWWARDSERTGFSKIKGKCTCSNGANLPVVFTTADCDVDQELVLTSCTVKADNIY